MINKKIAVIAGATGVCMLSAAAFANYSTSNGYDVLKKSILATKDYNNATVSLVMSAAHNDREFTRAEALYEVDGPNHMSSSKSDVTYDTALIADRSAGSEPDGSGFITDSSLNITDGTKYYYKSSDTKKGDYLFMHNYADSYGALNEETGLWGISKDDSNEADKVIRFVELLTDTVVGDLKNSVICTESDDEHTTYSMTLNGVQIPEVINAGANLMYTILMDEVIGVNKDVIDIGEDGSLSDVDMTFTVNKDNSFSNGTITAVLTGDTGDTITLTLDLAISDIGTTAVKKAEEYGMPIYTYGKDDTIVKVSD